MNNEVTVIMPVYNREQYVREAIESILVQTFTDFEFVILDDCSSDRTTQIIEEIHDDRIKLVKMKSKSSIPALRNLGLSLAEGKYIALMDSDDISEKNRLEHQVDFLNKNSDYSILGTDYEIFGNKAIEISSIKEHNRIVASIPFKSPIVNPVVMMRRQVLVENNIRYREEYFVCSDYALWADLIPYAKFNNLKGVYIHYRLGHGSNVTRNSIDDKEKLYKRQMLIGKIHGVALENLGIKVTPNELNIFNRVIGERYLAIPSQEEFQAFIELASSLKSRVDGSIINREVFSEVIDEEIEERRSRVN
jgi:glycosyltransferase involved in cell wall biosynthesis